MQLISGYNLWRYQRPCETSGDYEDGGAGLQTKVGDRAEGKSMPKYLKDRRHEEPEEPRRKVGVRAGV